MTAWSGCGSGPSSSWRECDGPLAPTVAVATAITFNAVDVTWNAATGADSYDIERDGVIIASGVVVLIYHDTGLTPNTTYAYRVRASTGGVPSSFSNTATVTPTWQDIPDRVLWLDASRSQDFTMGTGVRSWFDASGNGKILSQPLAAKQPLLVPSVLNGLAVVRCDGVDDFLSTAWAVELNAGHTIFVVAVPRFPNDAAGHPLVRFGGNVSGLQHESNTDPNPALRSRLELFSVTNAGIKRATPAAVTTQDAGVVLSAFLDPAVPVIELYKNGVLNGGPTAGFATLASSAADVLELATDGITPGKYDIGEVIIYRRAITAAERVFSEARLLTKWGL